jgi:hypothetical protein
VTNAQLRRAAVQERDRRARANRLTPPGVKTADVCHPKQAKLVDALVLGRHRNICALCGRQSGKSHGAAALAPLLLVLRTPGVNAVVVTATEASCEKMAFKPAVSLNRDLALGGRPHFAKGDLKIEFSNGSTVYFLGANHPATIDRLRGTPNLVLCVIDEAGIYDPETLAEMIKAVRPGLRPRRGKLCVMGTPSRAGKQGTWYDITENPEYDQHRFDYRDNDRVPDFATVEATIDEDLKAQFPHLTSAEARLTAWFLREYMAQFEVDLAEKVYQLGNDNLVDEIPDGPFDMQCSAGDLGMSANDSIVSAGWNDDSGKVYITDQEETSGQDSVGYAQMVNSHDQKRHPFAIVVDPGGLGQKTIKTVQRMHPNIPIEEAVKGPMGLQVRALNDLLQGAHGWRLYIKRGTKLALELARPTWVDGLVGGDIDEHGQHSDLCPPARYLAIKIRQYLDDLEPPRTEAEKAHDKYVASVERGVKKAKQARLRDKGYDAEEFEDSLTDDLDQ